jgi:hypothetical protein
MAPFWSPRIWIVFPLLGLNLVSFATLSQAQLQSTQLQSTQLQSTQLQSTLDPQLISLFIPPPPGSSPGKPANRRAGASRTLCEVATENGRIAPLTALVPESENRILTTTRTHPTFWFDIPYDDSEVNQMTLALFRWHPETQATGAKVYQTRLQPAADFPGIISVNLDYDLEPEKIYHWKLAVRYCSPDSLRPSTALVEGTIEAIPPSAELQAELAALPTRADRERAIVYARHSIWFEAITLLGNLRRDAPTDLRLQGDWNRLLESVGLEDVADVPILNCCQPGTNLVQSSPLSNLVQASD